MGRPSRELPKPAIADVLKELTGIDVPTGTGWVRCYCPFHEDSATSNSKSAAVNHAENGFACHSCSRRGDGLKLLQTELRLTFKEACDKARELGGTADRPKTKRRASDLLKGMT